MTLWINVVLPTWHTCHLSCEHSVWPGATAWIQNTSGKTFHVLQFLLKICTLISQRYSENLIVWKTNISMKLQILSLNPNHVHTHTKTHIPFNLIKSGNKRFDSHLYFQNMEDMNSWGPQPSWEKKTGNWKEFGIWISWTEVLPEMKTDFCLQDAIFLPSVIG